MITLGAYGDEMIDAILAFVVHGLYPGSCAECMLKGDFDGAVARAHPHLKLGKVGERAIDEYFTWIVECIPNYCKKENFDTWKGFDGDKSRELENAMFAEVLSGSEPADSLVNAMRYVCKTF